MHITPPHYELVPDHNVLICRISEHWVLDCTEPYIEAIKKIVSGFDNQPWCRVVNMLQFKLATPEVIARMHQFGRWSMDHHCLLHAFIFSNKQQQEQVEAAYNGLFPIVTFKTERDAIVHCCRLLRMNLLQQKADHYSRLPATGNNPR